MMDDTLLKIMTAWANSRIEIQILTAKVAELEKRLADFGVKTKPPIVLEAEKNGRAPAAAVVAAADSKR